MLLTNTRIIQTKLKKLSSKTTVIVLCA